METGNILYDAVIYCENADYDQYIAKNVYKLLRNRRSAGGRRLEVFLYDHGNERASLDALMGARFFIVLCSMKTKDSLVLNELINLCKSRDREPMNSILTLLIEGEPIQAFPAKLRYVSYCYTDYSTGKEIREQIEIEPLAADVRANTRRRALRLLKTEVLRIVAPLTGTTFDKLYNIQRKRRLGAIKRYLLYGAVMVLLAAVLTMAANYMKESRRAYYEGLLADNEQNSARYEKDAGKAEAVFDSLKKELLALYPDGQKTAIEAQLKEYEKYMYPSDADPEKYIQEIVEEKNLWNTSLTNENSIGFGDVLPEMVRFLFLFLVPASLLFLISLLILAGLVWFLYQSAVYFKDGIKYRVIYKEWSGAFGRDYPLILKRAFKAGAVALWNYKPLFIFFVKFISVVLAIIMVVATVMSLLMGLL